MPIGDQQSSRVFIVGCPRSGTTLLQSMLASSPEIVSFPETHYFRGLCPKPWWRLGPIIPDPALALEHFEKSAQLVGVPELVGRAPRGSRLKRKWVRSFLTLLDEASGREGARVWIEKTPEHLSFAPMIRRYARDVLFLHILREGRSVVASLVDVTRRHPEHWGGTWSVETALGFWNRAVIKHKRMHGKEGHVLVRYETLAADPAAVLRPLCKRMGVDFAESMLEAQDADKLITADEAWKSAVQGGSKGVAKSKYDTVLTDEERAYVEANILSADGLRGIGDG